MRHRKYVTSLLIAALLIVSATQSKAAAPVTVAGTTSGPGAGIWIGGTIIGVAAFLGIYDLTRRTACTGDFLKLGGPGFDSTITPNHNVLKPRVCR